MNNNGKSNRGSMIILTVIGIATLLIAVIGATFAYFTATVNYKTEPAQVVTKSETLAIEYSRENNIYYENIVPGRPAYEENAINTAKNSLKFNVSSNSTTSIKTNYDVYFVITKNEFEKSKDGTDYLNVVFVLNGEEGSSSIEKNDNNGNPIDLDSEMKTNCDSSVICGKGQVFTDSGYIDHTFAEESKPTRLGRVEALKSAEDGSYKIKIGSSTLGAFGAKDTWEFELWVNETGESQNEDQGKTIEGRIEIETSDGMITNEPEYVEENSTP